MLVVNNVSIPSSGQQICSSVIQSSSLNKLVKLTLVDVVNIYLPFPRRSAVYSDRFRTCRLSRYNQKDGMRIIYDADYDYYENLMCK